MTLPPPSLGSTIGSTTDTTSTHTIPHRIDTITANKPPSHPVKTSDVFLPSQSFHPPPSQSHIAPQSAPPNVTMFSHFNAFPNHNTAANASISSSENTPAFLTSQQPFRTMEEDDLLSPELQAHLMAVLGQSHPTALDDFSHIYETGHDLT